MSNYAIIITSLVALIIVLMYLYFRTNKVQYPYKNWTRDGFYKHFKESDVVKRMPQEIRDLIYEACYSTDWLPSFNFDGCTLVQDTFIPCPSCFVHDYLSRTGQGGAANDKLFYHINILEGTSKANSKRRFIAVRIGWIFYLKWKHNKSRNLNPFSANAVKAFNKFRIKH